MVWLQDGRGGLDDPRSRPELPHNIKDSARGWQGTEGQVQEAEPTAEGADFTRGASIRSGLGAGPSSSALPGVARPGALHPRAVLLRQDTPQS